jgi:hypothetical protein
LYTTTHLHHTLTFGPFCRAFLPVGDVLEMKGGVELCSEGAARWVTTRVSKRVFE